MHNKTDLENKCTEEALSNLLRGCHFPFITKVDSEERSCGITYAERIAPYHQIACIFYCIASMLLACITGLWWLNTWHEIIDRRRQPAQGSFRIMMRYRAQMHAFATSGSLCNVIASIDLKGYSNRLPLLVTEIFNEMAYSFLFCVLFTLINQWVLVITLGGRQKWGQRQAQLLPWMCWLSSALRVGLGIAQWLAAYGERNYVSSGSTWYENWL